MDTSCAMNYLGLDLSTQQLKAVVIDNENLSILYEASVQFDTELPEFRTHGGILQRKEKPHVVTAPTLMWVKAMDMLLDKLRVCGVDFSEIGAISGCAQQHGTVYWGKGSHALLQNLDPSKFLHEQLAMAFSVIESPIWMDSSTSAECQMLEAAVGGPQKLADITGSRAYERFSGPQIAKIAKGRPEAYSNTERISLISNFVASLFLGGFAPIDWSDGSGMNLLDIRKKDWNDTLLEACGPDLRQKLGQPIAPSSILGEISMYFVERFGFTKTCKIVAFTGDNPSSLIGMRLMENDIACSLGTSDTIFLWLKEPKIITDGHIFCNPLDDDTYMALLCYKNGSLTRERIRNSATKGSWNEFNEALKETVSGNFGNMGLFFDTLEIQPPLIGDYCFNSKDEEVVRFQNPGIESRALIEGQFIAKRSHTEDLGYVMDKNTRIIATGGASINSVILEILGDVFNQPVYSLDTKNSAVLGAAYAAKYGLVKHTKQRFGDMTLSVPQPVLAYRPVANTDPIYKPMIERYRKIVKKLLERNFQGEIGLSQKSSNII